MDEVAFRSFRARSREKERASNKMEAGPSVQKMSQELERLFAPPAVLTEVEEKKEIDSVQEISSPSQLLYSSPNRGLTMTPSPNLTPTRPGFDTGNHHEDHKDTRSANENDNNHSNEEDNGRSDFAGCIHQGLNREAANAMALHVVTKLRKEAFDVSKLDIW